MTGHSCWNKGKKMTQEFKKKCSVGTMKKYKQGWQPRLGKFHTKDAKEKMANSHIGKILSENHKLKLSKINTGTKNHFYGKHHTEEWKRKRRIQIMKRLEELSIPNREDKGAKQFFNKYNSENRTNFIPTKFMDIGYYADGYDKTLHEWIEYDTPMHKQIKQKNKDLIRQNNIINYFSSIEHPLIQFTRVKVNKSGDVIEIIHVL